MLDQELSLFHDTAPLFAITELQCPLPGPEVLWMSHSSEQWFSALQSLHVSPANVNPQILSTPSATPSLHELFQDFLHDNLLRQQPNLSPQQLRLILHPLQALVCHLRQMVSCFVDVFGTPRTSTFPVTKASTLHRLEEVQGLLQKWYDLTMSYSRGNPGCPVTHCNLVIYHLISLNAVTNFPEIERLARREGFGGLCWELPLRHEKCIFQRHKAIFHCSQIFRLLRLMPNNRRPAWWSAAMYRATMVLWADSVTRMDPNSRSDKHDNIEPQNHAPVVIDQLTPEDPALLASLWGGGGVPMLSCADGGTVGLDKPADLLTYAVRNIETCMSSRIGDGIKRKLISLGNNWNADVMRVSPSGSTGC